MVLSLPVCLVWLEEFPMVLSLTICLVWLGECPMVLSLCRRRRRPAERSIPKTTWLPPDCEICQTKRHDIEVMRWLYQNQREWHSVPLWQSVKSVSQKNVMMRKWKWIYVVKRTKSLHHRWVIFVWNPSNPSNLSIGLYVVTYFRSSIGDEQILTNSKQNYHSSIKLGYLSKAVIIMHQVETVDD